MKYIAAIPVLVGFVLVPAFVFAQESSIPERNMALGMRGAEVTWLQEYLIENDMGVAAKALAAVGATGYFGERTRAALAEFQAAHKVTPAHGYFGPLTRAAIASLRALPAPTFTGTIESVDTGCFADGICSVTISGKEVIVLTGMRIDPPPVGRLIGVPSIGDLEKRIGSEARVYAVATSEGDADYTLYGDKKYYVEVMPYIPKEGPITVRGTIGCLPPKYTDRPTIMMCAFGLKGEDGNYYALQDDGEDIGQFMPEKLVEVKGTYSKGDSETWKSIGTIKVTSVTEVK